jgi:hypothetical protein
MISSEGMDEACVGRVRRNSLDLRGGVSREPARPSARDDQQYSTQVRPADRLIVELGNEPNLHHGADFAQPYADSLHASIDAVRANFPGKQWIATEYGVNHAYDGDPTAQKQAKCRAYSDMIHRNGHVDIQNLLWGATYFHIDTSSPDPLFQAYNVAPDGPAGYQPRRTGGS